MLLLDVGNSRCKWALVQDGAWVRQGVAGNTEWAALRQTFSALTPPGRILVSNVAGEAMAERLRAVCAMWRCSLEFVTARASQHGVSNGYAQPERLGSDRWAALIAAWRRVHGACLVVNCGTATTVDALSAQGEFLGGLILPGVDLMRFVLHEHTGRLPLQAGRFVEAPRNTVDAIESGCRHAQAGAVERMYRIAGKGAHCLVSGGAGPALIEQLAIPCRYVENLVLEGLARIAWS